MSNSDYFRVTVTVLLLDHLMSELEMRFPGDELTAYLGIHIIPCVMFATPNTWRKEFIVFANFYSEDLPFISCLDSELDLWFTHWENLIATTDLAKSVAATSKNDRLSSFSKCTYFFNAACNTSSHYLWVWEIFFIIEAH